MIAIVAGVASTGGISGVVPGAAVTPGCRVRALARPHRLQLLSALFRHRDQLLLVAQVRQHLLDQLDRVAAELAGGPGRVYPLACHVGKPEQIQHLVETAHGQFGRVDILVNNAATNIAQEPVLQIDEPKFGCAT